MTSLDGNNPEKSKCLQKKNIEFRLSGDLVDPYFEKYRKREKTPVPDKITLTGPWNCFNIEDMTTGEVRPSVSSDVKPMFRLLGAVDNNPVSPVFPTDLPSPLQLLYLEKTGIETVNSNGSRMEFNDRQMLEFCIQMHLTAGHKYRLEEQFPISPLKVNPIAIQTLMDYMDRNDVDAVASTCPIPLAGLSAPFFIPGALVQAIAESIGSCILVDIATEGKIPIEPKFRIDLADMRHMTVLYASPLHIQYQILVRDVYEYFLGVPDPSIYFCCNAKKAGIQSMLERVSFMVTLAFAGFRHFCLGAGQLSMDEVFSPAQMVIDYEIANYVTHLISGLEFDSTPDLSYETIKECLVDGNYLTHESTLEKLGTQFESSIMSNSRLEAWKSAGKPDEIRMANDKAMKMIDSYDYECPPAVAGRLEEIYSEAQKYSISVS